MTRKGLNRMMVGELDVEHHNTNVRRYSSMILERKWKTAEET